MRFVQDEYPSLRKQNSLLVFYSSFPTNSFYFFVFSLFFHHWIGLLIIFRSLLVFVPNIFLSSFTTIIKLTNPCGISSVPSGFRFSSTPSFIVKISLKDFTNFCLVRYTTYSFERILFRILNIFRIRHVQTYTSCTTRMINIEIH